ncbi:hypothetical protein ALC60_00148 [Trachymyrmex zeteki]|uniref:Uncharacterized protein n=1 Tax=Mycetomoellerius zeteki TaxID=64791 RepID=A0A151XKC2_9HYME|nr:hypothetical protein ALC60_00148 [Trachymyrmex zeteki]
MRTRRSEARKKMPAGLLKSPPHRDAFDVEDGEGTRRWKDEVNTEYNHGEEPDSYSNYSSCKEFPAPSHPNVHSLRRRSTYVLKREYRCRLIPSAPLSASKGACPYYIGKLRSLVDIGDTSTSRKRFSCTGREQNPLVIGITSSLTLCTSDLVCVNGTRRTEKGGKIERQVVFAGGSLPGPRGEHEEGTEGCAGCTNETRGKEGTAYGSQGTRIAVLLRDHFLCKIKYCKYDGSGHTYTHAFTHIYTRTDEKLEGERGVFVFVDEGRMPLREVGPLRSRSSKEHTRRR